MPTALHYFLVTLIRLIGLVGGFALGMGVFSGVKDVLPDLLKEGLFQILLFGMLPASVGYSLLRRVFSVLVTARCPACGGRTVFQPSRLKKSLIRGKTTTPVCYRCRDCGHVHRTSVREGFRETFPMG